MNKDITTLLFDFDGTLLDTNELIVQTFLSVLGEHFPGEYGREDVLHFIGPSLEQTFTKIAPGKVSELSDQYRRLNRTLHDELVSEYDGVAKTLRTLKSRGLKMAIVSTKREETILHGLKLMGVHDVFDALVALDHVQNPKPHPEPLELALRLLEADQQEALMIGDNSHDIEGGKNAGVRTAGVAWTAKGEEFLASFEPDFMLQHISDLLELTKAGVK
ncbi:pyrophosphatase PpaX [Planococcus sp. CP5-4]|uniref:pyrophosphatase PpaX n=1 Tax=unclassified Planococcus (in: firmicutes) TaxID=2662419 RepID=UPI001C214FE2|nr:MULTISPECIES: pyrophosphatase PpaX [unclassified Planococcus (in: firmicutes)]MBU9674175.1 pyrophosphatase PpaX [Planococcus sp. CP5-4_YE]MBV0910006.1 pyrophosphatase PpaX [Planococcus sp. CP5-4_UN]MBW6064540.1 pyrophosphatase PpaX [Planococcus sp. CP5-4]